jgi:hypothetical protein
VLADDAEIATERYVAAQARRAGAARRGRIDHDLVTDRNVVDASTDRIDDAGPVGAADVGR